MEARRQALSSEKGIYQQDEKNQLTRALRIDKFTAAALELVLQEYLSEEKALQHIPVLSMITRKPEEVKRMPLLWCGS